ncbi:hypothetical protein [Vibrio sp. WXL103]|uniref:hypothetical protein n=1 Tax=Vibrio sp. WXL103 TaxID=3450710 RepID=UPI003EC84CBC
MSMNDVEHALQHFVKNLDDFLEVVQMQNKRVMHQLEGADGLFDSSSKARLKEVLQDLEKAHNEILQLTGPAISDGLKTRLRILRTYLYE